MNIKVSVIIPFYNSARFVEDTITSVLDQTFRDYELLLCDDGSTDGSTETARKYSSKYPDRIFYFEHPGHANRGQFSTRMLGAKHASAPVLALLDADDLWSEDYLEQHYSLWKSLESEGIYLSYGPSLYWFYEDGDRSKDHVQGMPEGAPKIYGPGELLEPFLRSTYGNTPCPSCVLIRREAFEGLVRYESVARNTLAFEDQILSWHVAARWPVAVHCNVWVKYRQRGNSSVSSIAGTKQARMAELEFLRIISNDLKEVPQDLPLIRQGRLEERLRTLSHPSMKELIKEWTVRSLPLTAYAKLNRAYHSLRTMLMRSPGLPVIRVLRCMQLRRLHPLRDGKQYGTPIVRYYWENYLQRHRSDVHGHALEIGTTSTIRKYGGTSLTQADAIDIKKHSGEITVVADLSKADNVPSDTYDCFVNQFSMTFIYNVEAALYHSIRILKPGGIMLVNFPCIEYYFPNGLEMFTGAPIFMYWWFTPIQTENMFRRLGLSDKDFKLEVFGNLFSRVAYEMNMPAEELTRKELGFQDAGHPLMICARIVKPQDWKAGRPSTGEPWLPAGEPIRLNPVTAHYPLLKKE